MFVEFRASYPTGQLISELLTIYHGKFVVRTSIQVEGKTLATGLAAAETVELAEDQARLRSLAVLGIPGNSATSPLSAPSPSLSTPAIAEPQPAVPLPVEPVDFPYQSSFVNEQKSLTDVAEMPPPEPLRSPLPSLSAIPPTVPPAPKQLDSDAWLSSTYSTSSQGSDLPSLSPPLSASEPLSPPSEAEGSAVLPIAPESDSEPSDDSEVIAQIALLLKRLKWNKEQEGDYLLQAYGKRSQSLLSSEELHDFLDYLEIFGKTSEEIKRIGWGTKQGREYLEMHYGKISRHHLNKEELLDFLEYLHTQ